MLPPSSVSGIRFGGTESFCSGGSVMSGRTVLEIKDLSKSFGKNKVLDGINLKVEEGTVCGLMGENGAGKSTMMKCLFGIYAKDEGQISLYGKPVDFKGPKEALESGVAMVHQELQQCLDRTVMDNLFLGRYPKKGGFVDEARMLRESNNLFARLKMNVNPQTVMRTMSVSRSGRSWSFILFRSAEGSLHRMLCCVCRRKSARRISVGPGFVSRSPGFSPEDMNRS